MQTHKLPIFLKTLMLAGLGALASVAHAQTSPGMSPLPVLGSKTPTGQDWNKRFTVWGLLGGGSSTDAIATQGHFSFQTYLTYDVWDSCRTDSGTCVKLQPLLGFGAQRYIFSQVPAGQIFFGFGPEIYFGSQRMFALTANFSLGLKGSGIDPLSVQDAAVRAGDLGAKYEKEPLHRTLPLFQLNVGGKINIPPVKGLAVLVNFGLENGPGFVNTSIIPGSTDVKLMLGASYTF